MKAGPVDKVWLLRLPNIPPLTNRGYDRLLRLLTKHPMHQLFFSFRLGVQAVSVRAQVKNLEKPECNPQNPRYDVFPLGGRGVSTLKLLSNGFQGHFYNFLHRCVHRTTSAFHCPK